MILTVDNQNVTLVQVTDDNTGESKGLYLVPQNVSIDTFETQICDADDQDEFDEKNDLGVQRIFAYDAFLDLKF